MPWILDGKRCRKREKGVRLILFSVWNVWFNRAWKLITHTQIERILFPSFSDLNHVGSERFPISRVCSFIRFFVRFIRWQRMTWNGNESRPSNSYRLPLLLPFNFLLLLPSFTFPLQNSSLPENKWWSKSGRGMYTQTNSSTEFCVLVHLPSSYSFSSPLLISTTSRYRINFVMILEQDSREEKNLVATKQLYDDDDSSKRKRSHSLSHFVQE